MAETRFTSGPWEVFEVRQRDGSQTLAVLGPQAEGKKICFEVVSWAGFDSSSVDDHDERSANAHLIAAAPALYRALKDLVDDIERWEDAVATVIGRDVGHGMDLTAARAALAAARGEGAEDV